MNEFLRFEQMSLKEIQDCCSCTEAAKDGEEQACPACCFLGAIDAGIPRSVIIGKQRLTDVFSKEYIDWKRGER